MDAVAEAVAQQTPLLVLRGALVQRRLRLHSIVTWIERTDHRRRRQDSLGRLTPIEFETIITGPATQAA